MYGHVWCHMVPFCPVWSFIVPYGPVWSSMVTYGPFWFLKVLYRPLWSRMMNKHWFCAILHTYAQILCLFSTEPQWINSSLQTGLRSNSGSFRLGARAPIGIALVSLFLSLPPRSKIKSQKLVFLRKFWISKMIEKCWFPPHGCSLEILKLKGSTPLGQTFKIAYYIEGAK